MSQEAFMIGAFCMGLATGWMAQRRGRNVIGWMVLGWLLGVIAFIACAVLPDRSRSTSVY